MFERDSLSVCTAMSRAVMVIKQSRTSLLMQVRMYKTNRAYLMFTMNHLLTGTDESIHIN